MGAPGEGDRGKRAWAWPLPGNHPSQIRSGVLLGWDSQNLRLEISGTVHGLASLAAITEGNNGHQLEKREPHAGAHSNREDTRTPPANCWVPGGGVTWRCGLSRLDIVPRRRGCTVRNSESARMQETPPAYLRWTGGAESNAGGVDSHVP